MGFEPMRAFALLDFESSAFNRTQPPFLFAYQQLAMTFDKVDRCQLLPSTE